MALPQGKEKIERKKSKEEGKVKRKEKRRWEEKRGAKEMNTGPLILPFTPVRPCIWLTYDYFFFFSFFFSPAVSATVYCENRLSGKRSESRENQRNCVIGRGKTINDWFSVGQSEVRLSSFTVSASYMKVKGAFFSVPFFKRSPVRHQKSHLRPIQSRNTGFRTRKA